MQANVKIETTDSTREFKVFGYPREVHAFISQMRALEKRLNADR